MEERQDLIGVLRSLYKWRKAIISTTILGAILSIGASLLMTEYFQARTTFYAASTDLNKPDRLFGDSDASYSYYGFDADIDRLRTIGESSDLVKFMVDSFQLFERYDIDPSNAKGQHFVELAFQKNYKIIRTEYDALEIYVDDKSPEIAAVMANTARQKINQTAINLIKDSQKRQMDIYRSTIKDQSNSIIELENELKTVQKQYGAVSKNITSAGSVKLESLLTQLEQLGSDQSKLKDKLNKLSSAYNTKVPAIHIIEEAKVPVVKSRPLRSVLVIASTMAAFIFSMFGALLFDYYKSIDWEAVRS